MALSFPHDETNQDQCNSAKPRLCKKSKLVSRKTASAVRTAVGTRRRRPTLRQLAIEKTKAAASVPGSDAASIEHDFIPIPLPRSISRTNIQSNVMLKYRLPYFKSIARLRAEGIELLGKCYYCTSYRYILNCIYLHAERRVTIL